MNSLDALFSRQVPARANGGGADAAGGYPDGSAANKNDSFAKALSGEYQKQRHAFPGQHSKDFKQGDDNSEEIESELIGNATEAMPVLEGFDFEIDGEIFGSTGSRSLLVTQKGINNPETPLQTNGYFDIELAELPLTDKANDNQATAEAEDLLSVSTLVDVDVEPAAKAKVDIEPAAKVEVDVEPAVKAEIDTEIPNPPGKSELKSGVSGDVVANAHSIEVAARTAVPQNGFQQPNSKDRVGSVPQPAIMGSGEKTAQATLSAQPAARKTVENNQSGAVITRDEPTATKPNSATETLARVRDQSGQTAFPRSDQDARIDDVRVIERRTIAAPKMSQNGEAVAKALIQTNTPISQPTSGQTVGQAPSTAHVNASALTQSTGPKVLHTLNIQLNPINLGQVTAVMKMTGDELSVELKVQTSEAYRVLKEDSSAITKSLRNQGYSVEHITIQHTPADSRPSLTSQQGQSATTASQQFQLHDGDTRSASGNRNGEDGQQKRNGRSNNQSGESTHDNQTASADGVRNNGSVYL